MDHINSNFSIGSLIPQTTLCGKNKKRGLNRAIRACTNCQKRHLRCARENITDVCKRCLNKGQRCVNYTEPSSSKKTIIKKHQSTSPDKKINKMCVSCFNSNAKCVRNKTNEICRRCLTKNIECVNSESKKRGPKSIKKSQVNREIEVDQSSSETKDQSIPSEEFSPFELDDLEFLLFRQPVPTDETEDSFSPPNLDMKDLFPSLPPSTGMDSFDAIWYQEGKL